MNIKIQIVLLFSCLSSDGMWPNISMQEIYDVLEELEASVLPKPQEKRGYLKIRFPSDYAANIKHFETVCDLRLYDPQNQAEIFDKISDAFNAGIAPSHQLMEKYLVEAVQRNNYDLTQLMLKKGVSANSHDCKQRKAISFASTLEMAQLLKKHNAHFHVTNEHGNLIHNVLANGYEEAELIDFYAKNGVDIHSENEKGLTPLNYFCQNAVYSEEVALGYIEAFLVAGISEEQIAQGLTPFLPKGWQDPIPKPSSGAIP